MWRRTSRWSSWTARVARRDRIVTLRRRNYRHLAEQLADIPGTRVLWPALPEDAVPYVLPFWVERPELSYQRVRGAGVPVFRWDDVWPTSPKFPGDCGPVWADHVFQLGCHQDLGLDDLDRMATTLRAIFAEDGP